MLVLSRKTFERIHIGEDVVVTVVAIDGGKVRIGIEAPRDTKIVRDELLPKDAAGRVPHGAEVKS